jgi:hypothetical protein
MLALCACGFFVSYFICIMLRPIFGLSFDCLITTHTNITSNPDAYDLFYSPFNADRHTIYRYWDTRQANPAHVQQLPDRCYSLAVNYPLMIVGTADRHIVIFNLQSPQVIVFLN